MGWLIAFAVVGVIGLIAVKSNSTESSTIQNRTPKLQDTKEARIAFLLGRGDQASAEERYELMSYLIQMAKIDVPIDRVMSLIDKKEKDQEMTNSEIDDYREIAEKLFTLADSGRVPGFTY
jgi:hypothetical protein